LTRRASGRGLAVIWSSDSKLAETVVTALQVSGFSAVVPGARSARRLCSRASLIVLDARDEAYAPQPCRSGAKVLRLPPAPVVASVLRVLSFVSSTEVLIGIDPGEALTGYAVLSNSALVYGAVYSLPPRVLAERTCLAAAAYDRGQVLVGIGASSAVRSTALELAARISSCGVPVVLVDESGSNSEHVRGLWGLEGIVNSHIRAAAVIALRAQMRDAILG